MSISQTIIDIGPFQLALCLGFVCLAGATSIYHKLGLEKDLFVGTIRTFAQLFLMGYVLKFIFDAHYSWLVILIYSGMVAAAAHIIKGRIKEKSVSFIKPMYVTMLLSYTLVTLVVTGVIIGAKPWWTPQYFIPMGGMIIGNSMNAIAIALDRLFSDLKNRRAEVEMKLALGADYREASQDILRDAVKAGMIPSINSLMAVGLVSLPGMMTGQILAGTDPLIAIRYQIVVMLMIVAATSLGSLVITGLIRRKCFSAAQRLLLR